MKRVISLSIAILFLLQIFSFNLLQAAESQGTDKLTKAEAEKSVVTFKDISGHWAESKINTLAEKGYVKGYETKDGNVINPNSNITRAEYLSILLKTVKLTKVSENVKTFSDVKEGDWYKETVDVASSNGIVGGYPDGSFGANNPITRAEMAFILANINGWSEKQSLQNVFADVNNEDWYYDAVMICKSKNIINGYPNGTFAPNMFATRAEAFAIVVNCINGETVKNEDVPAGNPIVTTTAVATATLSPTQNLIFGGGGGGGKSKKKSTPTPTNTVVPTVTEIPVATNTIVPTITEIPVATNTIVPTVTETPVATNTVVPTVAEIPTNTPTNTVAPTATETPVPTNTTVPTVTAIPMPTNTEVPTVTSIPMPTNIDVPTDTATVTPTATTIPTETPTETPVPTNTDVPTTTATPEPTNTDVPTTTVTPEPTTTETPVQINAEEVAYPSNITGVGSVLLNYVTAGGIVDEGADALIVKDSNGDIVNMKTRPSRYLDKNGKVVYYYLYATSNYPDRVEILNRVVYGNSGIKYQAGPYTGVATLTYKLIKDNDLNPDDGWLKEDDNSSATESLYNPAVDTYTMTVHNIAIGDVTSYKLDGSATIWAIDPVVSSANLTGINPVNGITNDQLGESKQEFKVRGYNSLGKEVAIPGSIVSDISVSDTTNFKIIGYCSGSKYADVYGLRADDDAKTIVTAFINVDGKQYTPSAEIKSSKEAPVAQSISVALADPRSDGTGSIFQDVGGGIYEVTAADLAMTMNYRSLAKFRIDGTGAWNALRVEVKDQYGKVALLPEYIMATAKAADGTEIDSSIFNYDSIRNIMTVSSSIPDKSIITVIATSNGKSLTFFIRVNNNPYSRNIVTPFSGITNIGTINKITPEPSEIPQIQGLEQVGSGKILVKFSSPVGDPEKAKFEVLKETVPQSMNLEWSSDNTQAILSKTKNLSEGEYSVSVNYDGKSLGAKTIEVVKNIITIEIPSSSIIITEKGNAYVCSRAIFKYGIKNQFGEDLTDSKYSNEIKWSTRPYGDNNLLQVNKEQGIVTIVEAIGKNDIYDNRGKEMSVFASCYSENVSVSKNLVIDPIIGGVKEFKVTGLTNEDGLTQIVKGSSDEFVLGYEAKDADGNLIDYFDIFTNEDIFRFTPDPALNGDITDQYKGEPIMLDLQNDGGKLKIVVKASDELDADYGEALVYVVCYATGFSSQYDIDVKQEAEVESVTLQVPSDVIAGTTVEIPYTAVDTDGRVLTDYKDIIGPDHNGVDLTTFKLKGGNSKLRTESINGKLKIYVDVGSQDYDETLTLTATVNGTGKYSRIKFKVGDPVYPSDITGAGSALLTYVTAGGIVDEGADALTVKDDYGYVVNMKNSTSRYLDEYGNSVYYYVYVTSNNPDRVEVLNGTVYGNNGVKYKAGANTGSATLTYKLLKDNDLNPNDGWLMANTYSTVESIYNSPVDTYTMAVNNIAIGDVVSYQLFGSSTIWAIDQTRSNANLAYIDVSTETPNEQIKECAQEFKVKGYNSSGKEIAIPDSIVSQITVGDTRNFKIIGYTSGKAANVYGLRADNDAKSVVTAFINADGKQYTPSAEIKSSKVMPVAQTLSVGLADPAIDGTGSTFQDVGGGIYEVTAQKLYDTMNGKSLAKFNNDGTDAKNALRIEVIDQYGKVSLIPQYIMATAKTSDGFAIYSSVFNYDSTNNVMTVSSSIPDKSIITVTAASGGKSLTFFIRINNELVK